MTDFLDRLRARREDMTAREREIAAHLEGGYPHAGLESATAVGERLKVSAATVVRFIAKLGYSGYADFQREMRDEVQARLASPLQRLESPAPDGVRPSGATDVVGRTFETALAAVTRTYGSADRRMIETVSELLLGCKGRIWIVGEKKARAVALYFYAQLNLCLGEVNLVSTDGAFEADRLLEIGPDDVVIAFDLRRYVEATLKVAGWALQRGAALVVFADSSGSPLYGRTPYRLIAATNSAGAFDSYVGLMFLVDAVTNVVTLADPDRTRERLKRGEEAWSHFEVFIRGQSPHSPRMIGEASG